MQDESLNREAGGAADPSMMMPPVELTEVAGTQNVVSEEQGRKNALATLSPVSKKYKASIIED